MNVLALSFMFYCLFYVFSIFLTEIIVLIIKLVLRECVILFLDCSIRYKKLICLKYCLVALINAALLKKVMKLLKYC